MNAPEGRLVDYGGCSRSLRTDRAGRAGCRIGRWSGSGSSFSGFAAADFSCVRDADLERFTLGPADEDVGSFGRQRQGHRQGRASSTLARCRSRRGTTDYRRPAGPLLCGLGERANSAGG